MKANSNSNEHSKEDPEELPESKTGESKEKSTQEKSNSDELPFKSESAQSKPEKGKLKFQMRNLRDDISKMSFQRHTRRVKENGRTLELHVLSIYSLWYDLSPKWFVCVAFEAAVWMVHGKVSTRNFKITERHLVNIIEEGRMQSPEKKNRNFERVVIDCDGNPRFERKLKLLQSCSFSPSKEGVAQELEKLVEFGKNTPTCAMISNAESNIICVLYDNKNDGNEVRFLAFDSFGRTTDDLRHGSHFIVFETVECVLNYLCEWCNFVTPFSDSCELSTERILFEIVTKGNEGFSKFIDFINFDTTNEKEDENFHSVEELDNELKLVLAREKQVQEELATVKRQLKDLEEKIYEEKIYKEKSQQSKEEQLSPLVSSSSGETKVPKEAPKSNDCRNELTERNPIGNENGKVEEKKVGETTKMELKSKNNETNARKAEEKEKFKLVSFKDKTPQNHSRKIASKEEVIEKVVMMSSSQSQFTFGGMTACSTISFEAALHFLFGIIEVKCGEILCEVEMIDEIVKTGCLVDPQNGCRYFGACMKDDRYSKMLRRLPNTYSQRNTTHGEDPFREPVETIIEWAKGNGNEACAILTCKSETRCFYYRKFEEENVFIVFDSHAFSTDGVHHGAHIFQTSELDCLLRYFQIWAFKPVEFTNTEGKLEIYHSEYVFNVVSKVENSKFLNYKVKGMEKVNEESIKHHCNKKSIVFQTKRRINRIERELAKLSEKFLKLSRSFQNL